MINFLATRLNNSFPIKSDLSDNTKIYFVNTPLIFDTFVKSVEPTKEVTKEQKIQKLFDETYNEVLFEIKKSNPILSELNLPKPKTKITDFDSKDQIASYNFSDNEILLSRNYDQNYNLFISRNSDGSINRHGAANEKDIDEIKKSLEKKGYKDVKVLKFTKSEIDFQIKETIAHELRHYFQQHLIASTKTASTSQKEHLADVYNNIKKSQQDYINSCKKEGIEPDKEFVQIHIPSYWDKYKPKKMLDENLTIKFNSDKNDKRYWSVKDDLYTYSEELIKKEDKEENYLGRPSEIDAYNFEYEYIQKYAQNYNVSPDIKAYMLGEISERRDKGIEYMNKNGHNFKIK